ncbi:taste receptor type 2 member 9-like [Rana temporaria]|uniref:taste receptor type 2 member 9-like n=1 Tax=Rana temporaria TaxID=8407 RepID=UPI001AACC82E|nr:taste receptor type 2 member 9-like [Rana temporaria]
MSLTVETLVAVVNVLQLGMGLALNSCIFVFSFQNLKNGLSVHPTNLIYSIKGLVNIFLQLVLTAETVLNILWPHLFFIREVHLTLVFLMLSPIYYNYWLTGWLCAHFCVNISSFTHKLLVGFKRLLSSFLPRVLLLSAIVSFVMSVLNIWEVHKVSQECPSSNTTRDAVVFLMPAACRLMATFLGCCLPFLLALVSIGCTTSSLIRHIMKMKQKFSGNSCPNLQVLINTTKTMIWFLALSIISYIIGLVLISRSTNISSDMMMMIGCFSIMPFPLIEAAVIIHAIPKLRKMIVGKVCQWKLWCKENGNCT